MDRVQRGGAVAGALLVAVAAFQVALVLGAPWGEATQGGRASLHDGVLDAGPRVLAGISACLLLLGAWVVVARAGVVQRAPLDGRRLRVAAWVVVAFLAVNTLTNLTGDHPAERFGMTAVTLVALALSVPVARSAPR